MRSGVTLRSSLFVGLATLLMIGDQQASTTRFRDYDPKVPLDVHVTNEEKTDALNKETFYYQSTPGQYVPGLMVYPGAEGKYPCIVFLHGIGQNKSVLNEVDTTFAEYGFAIASFDQFMQGERDLPDETGPFGQAFAFRQRPYLTITDARRLVDYMAEHPAVDPDRIYLVGASYGAITGATVAALDKRLKAAILVYGGGDFSTMLNAREIQNMAGPIVPALQALAEWYLGPADPVKHIGKISPRPVLIQNGRNDRLIATEAAEALHNAAREPKTIKWYDSDHLLTEATIRMVLEDALAWLKERDAEVQENVKEQKEAAKKKAA